MRKSNKFYWFGDRSADSEHLLYLQLRKDVLENRWRVEPAEEVQLAALALLIEFGPHQEKVHGGGSYFHADHYLSPGAQRWIRETSQNIRSLERLHQRLPKDLGRRETEFSFVARVIRTDSYGFHNVHVIEVGRSAARCQHGLKRLVFSLRAGRRTTDDSAQLADRPARPSNGTASGGCNFHNPQRRPESIQRDEHPLERHQKLDAHQTPHRRVASRSTVVQKAAILRRNNKVPPAEPIRRIERAVTLELIDGFR